MKNEADNKNERERDDLTLISGIGQTRQQWLQEKLHIYSFRDLAALPVSEILNKMKAEGQIISQSRIESWIKQAQQFVDSAGERLPLTVRDDGWKPFASFVVEFQTHQTADGSIERHTKVHHMEADQTKMWAGIEHDELCAWMIQHLGIEAEPIPAVAELPEPPPALEHIQQLIATIQREAAATSPAGVSVTAQPSPGGSTRYQRLLARVQQEAVNTTPSTTMMMPQPSPGDSERYQRLLAGVQQETGATSRPEISAAAQPPTGSGERYQRLLARVQAQGTAATNTLVTAAPQPPESGSRYQRLLARVQAQERSAR